MKQYKLWINNAWVDSIDGATMQVEDPATGQPIAEVVNASRADVNAAVSAAREAFYDGRWSRLTPSERSLAIWRLGDLLEQHKEEFARAESDNTGKPYEFVSLGADMPFAIDNLRFFSAAARDSHGHTAGEYAKGFTSIYRKEPVGVVGQITPWNYPLMMAIWKIGPALAAGCTIVLKPAPSTPITTLMLAELCAEAGIPAGVFNVVTGDNETGQALVEHPDIRMVSLTGSTGTGKKIMKTAADTLKRVHLELGGKAPFIVFDDVNVENVAAVASLTSTFNTGQDCTAATRLYVESSRANDVIEAVVEAMRAIKVGRQYDEGVAMGPLISGTQLERVKGFVDRARSAGATVLTGGEAIDMGGGYFYAPTVIVDADQKSEVIQSEIFGPVLTINTFKAEAEALQLGNDVLYGLAASLWTQDIGRAMRLSRDLEFGTVWINDHIPLASETPHGGFKQSGFGKDLSAESVNDYRITKHVMIKNS
ncbi:MAG: putative aldehyde dehydrogenase [Chloroflexi bacterium OLB15]|nr:MAG: putative aldehyde dehydrogenase [Chloroflexi bacterium OLB15]